MSKVLLIFTQHSLITEHLLTDYFSLNHRNEKRIFIGCYGSNDLLVAMETMMIVKEAQDNIHTFVKLVQTLITVKLYQGYYILNKFIKQPDSMLVYGD